MFGYAVGCIGLSVDDFCRLTPEEYNSIAHANFEQREAIFRGDWERIRLLATITIQPHIKKKITAQKLLPFSWDKPKNKKKEVPTISKEQQKERFLQLLTQRKKTETETKEKI